MAEIFFKKNIYGIVAEIKKWKKKKKKNKKKQKQKEK